MRSAGARKVTKKKINVYSHATFQDSVTVNHIADAARPDVSKIFTVKPKACPFECLVTDRIMGYMLK